MRHDTCPGSWCDIHRDRISRNLEIARSLVPQGRDFCAVLKADAYGHGIAQVVPLVIEQGVGCVGITSNAEAFAVRDAGFGGRLIRLRAATAAEIDAAAPARVQEQAGSLAAAQALRAQRDAGREVAAHLALDAAGMSRDGLEIATQAGRDTCLQILETLAGNVVGICTHFPSNAGPDLAQTAALFQHQAAWVCDNGGLDRSRLLVHAGSSLTLISDQPIETDMYRCGAILYGILRPDLGFRTTMDLKARVVSIGDFPKGATVGYDRALTLEGDRRLACLSVGYANGFPRRSEAGSVVAIRDHLAPTVGKISMNTVVVDVTDIAGIAVGDEATVFGGIADGQASLDVTQRQFGTILADLFSDWGARNHRIYR